MCACACLGFCLQCVCVGPGCVCVCVCVVSVRCVHVRVHIHSNALQCSHWSIPYPINSIINTELSLKPLVELNALRGARNINNTPSVPVGWAQCGGGRGGQGNHGNNKNH